jgi:diguanylate cyclase (GGDEF)-like protein/PAS domain S-box-containing protein
MKRRAWLAYLAVATPVTVVFVIGALLHHRQGWLFNIVAVSSPIAIVAGIRLHKPSDPWPWYLFALGMLLFGAGDVITYHYNFWFHQDLPFPSWGDPLYLGFYPCAILGLLLLVRRRSPGRDGATLIDSVMVAVGVGVMSWTFLIAPYATDASLINVVSMAYPLGDLLLLTAVARLAFGVGRRSPSFYMIAGGALALFVTDGIYSFISAQGIIYGQNGSLEVGWGVFYILLAASALHPSMTTMTEQAPEREERLTMTRLGILAAASLVGQGVRVIQLLRHEQVAEPVLITSSVALFLLVVARMGGLLHKLELSFGREKTLRKAGASLVTATNRESIFAATMDAIQTLVPEGESRLLVHPLDDEGIEDLDRFTVSASSGFAQTDAPAPEISVGSISPRHVDRLEEHGSLTLDLTESPFAVLGFEADKHALVVTPLFMKGTLAALLVVASVEPLPRSVCDSLEALSSQVALALDSAALTEDLLRQESEARFSSLVQNSSDVVITVDADTTIRYISPSVERVLGYDPSSLEGTKLSALIHSEDRAGFLQFLMNSTKDDEGHPGLIEFRLRHSDDFWLHVETLRTNLLHDPNVKGIVLNTRDVSERKAFEEQLAHQAFHDSVTGLANRALFKDRVEHALERQTRADRPVSVLFMDLDDFKTINDSLGHAAGDRLLGEVGERVKGKLRTADTAARLGGDEFAVLLEDGGDGVGAADVAARILTSLDAPFHLEGKEVFVRASIGIATADHERHKGPEGAEELLRNADVAMYMAKESGKGRYQIFETAMHETALKRLELKADLQRAVDGGEFVLFYQPIIELETNSISGLEALIRWNHPTRGMVPPLEFIPLAEETGLIVPIGKWVLREACKQTKMLHDRYPGSNLHIAVNLSARQLQRPEIVGEVAEVLMETGIDASSLVLEITESVMMQDMDLSIQRLSELKELGVKLAVDDFGTGYSSLNYIRRFPVDILKVDKSFVDGVNEGGEESALTAAIIELAGILKLRPVAEGIERADQLEKLLQLRCDLGQGYYFAKPVPMTGIDELLEARSDLAHRDAELSS